MPQMKYIDMHCDSLSLCLGTGELEEKIKNLNYGSCAAQCFAIFTQGIGAAFKFRECLKLFKESAERGLFEVI